MRNMAVTVEGARKQKNVYLKEDFPGFPRGWYPVSEKSSDVLGIGLEHPEGHILFLKGSSDYLSLKGRENV